jgi:hypothetical protein
MPSDLASSYFTLKSFRVFRPAFVGRGLLPHLQCPLTSTAMLVLRLCVYLYLCARSLVLLQKPNSLSTLLGTQLSESCTVVKRRLFNNLVPSITNCSVQTCANLCPGRCRRSSLKQNTQHHRKDVFAGVHSSSPHACTQDWESDHSHLTRHLQLSAVIHLGASKVMVSLINAPYKSVLLVQLGV